VIGVVLPDKKVRESLPDAVNAPLAGGIDALSHRHPGPPTSARRSPGHLHPRRRARAYRRRGQRRGDDPPQHGHHARFLMTDAALDPDTLQRALREAVEQSFNAILRRRRHVDERHGAAHGLGQTVIECPSLREDSPTSSAPSTKSAATWPGMIVRDGEGATRVMELEVRGARSERDARLAATLWPPRRW
jgi:hypothetical protein